MVYRESIKKMTFLNSNIKNIRKRFGVVAYLFLFVFFSSFYDFSIEIWNSSYSVVYLFLILLQLWQIHYTLYWQWAFVLVIVW